jgi:hypothetical protein
LDDSYFCPCRSDKQTGSGANIVDLIHFTPILQTRPIPSQIGSREVRGREKGRVEQFLKTVRRSMEPDKEERYSKRTFVPSK